GRVFAIDNGMAMVAIGLSGVAASLLLEWGVGPRTVALIAGVGLIGVGVIFAVLQWLLPASIGDLERECRLRPEDGALYRQPATVQQQAVAGSDVAGEGVA